MLGVDLAGQGHYAHLWFQFRYYDIFWWRNKNWYNYIQTNLDLKN